MTTRIFLAALLLAACSRKKEDKATDKAETAATPAASISAEDRTLAEKWSVLYEEYAVAMEGAGADCARAAAAIREVNQKNAELVATGKARMAELRRDPSAAGWLDATIKPKLGSALDRMAPALDVCRGNADVAAALAAGAFDKKP
jgi:hypothetical protein